jgi:pimeloyl-ACP methyl ester carboxylesterase
VTVFYLHGFASGAQSSKAAWFAGRLLAHGIKVVTPDFNHPDFATLTISRMLEQLEHQLAGLSGPIALIGSSLGGTLAILAADRFRDRVDRVVLLAPAVMFAKPGHHLLPPERIEEWQRAGALPFFHHKFNDERLLGFSFYEDSLRYDPFEAELAQPTLIFQGLHDASVDYRTVEAFARTRTNVTLSLLDDDHQLIASLPRIWESVEPFLGIE